MKNWDVFIYGDVNIDLIVPNVKKFPNPGEEDVVETMKTFVGGGAALTALGFGKLGLSTMFQGMVGEDIYGTFIREEFKKWSIDCSLLTVNPHYDTGISISFTNEENRCFLTYKGSNSRIDITEMDMERLQKAKHLHITSYGGRSNHEKYVRVLKEIHKMGDVTVSLDVGWDDSLEWYEGIVELFPYIDVLFMNETEAIHYSRCDTAEEGIDKLSKSCKLVVCKMGAKGSIAVQDGNCYEAKPFQTKAVDTTGAGDSFNAGFIYGYLNGEKIEQCLLYGNGCGAMSVQSLGGNTSFPLKRELEELIQEKN